MSTFRRYNEHPQSPCFISVFDVTVSRCSALLCLFCLFGGDKSSRHFSLTGASYPYSQSVFNDYSTASFVSNEAGDAGAMQVKSKGSLDSL